MRTKRARRNHYLRNYGSGVIRTTANAPSTVVGRVEAEVLAAELRLKGFETRVVPTDDSGVFNIIAIPRR